MSHLITLLEQLEISDPPRLVAQMNADDRDGATFHLAGSHPLVGLAGLCFKVRMRIASQLDPLSRPKAIADAQAEAERAARSIRRHVRLPRTDYQKRCRPKPGRKTYTYQRPRNLPREINHGD